MFTIIKTITASPAVRGLATRAVQGATSPTTRAFAAKATKTLAANAAVAAGFSVLNRRFRGMRNDDLQYRAEREFPGFVGHDKVAGVYQGLVDERRIADQPITEREKARLDAKASAKNGMAGALVAIPDVLLSGVRQFGLVTSLPARVIFGIGSMAVSTAIILDRHRKSTQELQEAAQVMRKEHPEGSAPTTKRQTKEQRTQILAARRKTAKAAKAERKTDDKVAKEAAYKVRKAERAQWERNLARKVTRMQSA